MRRHGFTLLELMIVVVIIGILVTIALPSFYRMRGRASEASVKTNAHTVQLAAEDFAVQNAATYPTDDTTGVVGVGYTIDGMGSDGTTVVITLTNGS